ncbi:unnamed protein product [Rotaria sp. Silwood2]|nr:unnamed protein product [Rotaria sp. Silwood2]
MEFDHRQLLSLLDELMKPISTVKISSEDEEQQQILTINLIFSNAIDHFLEISKSMDLIIPLNQDEQVYYRYLQIHINLIEKILSYEQKNFSSHLPLFSIQDETILNRSLSFIILLELILSHLQLLYSPNLKYSSEIFLSIYLQDNLNYLKENFSNQFIQQILLLNRLLSTTINSPLWLKKQCGNLLTSILINSNNHGIQQILETIFESTLPNDHLYISIAKILSTCPKQLKPDEYIQCIKFQFIQLIHNQRFMPVICISINVLFKKYSKLIENEIFLILFQPLFICHKNLSNEICTNEQFELFINDLYNLISIVSNEQIRIYLYENYLNELINIYIALEKSLSSLKIQFLNILKILFSSMNIDICIEYFKKILFDFKYLSLKYLPDLSIKYNLIIDNDYENNIEIYCQSIIKILFSIDNNDCLIVKIFLDLLQLLITNKQLNQASIWTENDKQINIKQCKIMLILKYIMEYLTEHIDIFIKNVDDTIKVIQIILEKITITCQEKTKENLLTKINVDDDDDDLSSDNEALQIIFTIASLLITHYDQLSFENKQILASFYSSLIWIEQNYPNNELCQLAHELSIAFITYGAVKEESTKKKSTLLIEELNDERDLREETFQNALTCLYDSSIPIRAHGLILFRRLIERNDNETISKIQDNNMKLFQQFQEHLHADDSYEYLAAINVLSALANQFTDKILPLLCHEYISKNRKLENKLKVGEILVKTCHSLGDMSTKYSSLLINTFLNASKQTDDDMYRTSALSNLGQLCTVLKYSLSKDLSEILIALKSYLSISESSNVRRASILVCELLCKSLEQSTWLTILGNELPSFYQLINYLYKNDKDDIVCLHAQIALEALNKICQDYLQPPVILEKKIRILS